MKDPLILKTKDGQRATFFFDMKNVVENSENDVFNLTNDEIKKILIQNAPESLTTR